MKLNYNFSDPEVRANARFWPVVEACYSRTWNQYAMDPHFHNRAEIMYVLKGWCLIHLFEYEIDENQKARVTREWTERLGAGDFIFLEQGVLHALEVPETSYMLNAELRLTPNEGASISLRRLAETSPDLRAFLDRPPQPPIWRGSDASGALLRTLEQVVAEFSRPAPSESAALMDVFTAELLLRIADIAKHSPERTAARSYAERAANYIALHLSEEFRVSDIAREVGVASATLQRVFKRAMGVTLVDYINRLRVEQSKRFMMYTEDPIIDIAIASGFNSRQHFYRVFQAIEHMSPQEYRKRHCAKDVRQVFIYQNTGSHRYDPEWNLLPDDVEPSVRS
ncbi:MAG: helix-turn-helix transcriptional regulator [Clostridia bacterium]|nr:helix-turn-helix transcriptional regulator [Clostridia bacterium]